MIISNIFGLIFCVSSLLNLFIVPGACELHVSLQTQLDLFLFVFLHTSSLSANEHFTCYCYLQATILPFIFSN